MLETNIAAQRDVLGVTSELHKTLLEQYEGVDPNSVETNPDAPALMSFNGYYSIDTASGAFFSVDTNMIIIEGAQKPVYHVSLIVSLDGKTSHIYGFTKGSGTFDGTHLKFNEHGTVLTLPIIDLEFERGDSSNLVTASLRGTIQMPHKKAVSVFGKTYNNIIPMSTYNGTYYESSKSGVSDKIVMEILDNYTLNYKGIGETAELKQVKNFAYNMNMYFFSFTSDSNTVKVIMGTSSNSGKVCNNLVVTPKPNSKLYSRSLQTVRTMNKTKGGSPAAGSKALAQFSGFYGVTPTTPESKIKEGAFISIEGVYETLNLKGTPEYSVSLGISFDGTTCYTTLVNTNMTFDGTTLTVPDFNGNSVEITFKREYTQEPGSQFGSLVTISGKTNDDHFSGSTALNPVPLMAFSGMVLSDGSANPETLEIISETELKYNGTQYQVIAYVPLMYIAVFLLKDDTKVTLSLGTDGGRGTSCIVKNPKMNPATSAVYGIPAGNPGQ